VCVGFAAAPSIAFAQSAIAGLVKDTSGAVLPGVTVEASSPALIEKTRTVVTDGDGLYKIVDLRPGTYSVTFSLTGFATVKRDGIDIPAAFTATVNADLRVGAVEETITVAGQAPTVDVQNVAQRTLLNKDLLDAVPTARTPQSFVPYLPGVTGGLGEQAIGRSTAAMAIHGGRTGESIVGVDGMQGRNLEGAGGTAATYYVNQAIVQEIVVQLAAQTAEYQSGGIFTNVIPKEGGNRFSGFFFASYGNENMQGDNLNNDLRAAGLTIAGLKKSWDFNPAVGGPLLRDQLWFYSSYRNTGAVQYIPGLYYSQDPLAWRYVADVNRPAVIEIDDRSSNTRLTWQATPRNKIGLFYDAQPHIVRQRNYAATVAPEATTYAPFLPNYFALASWKSPLTNKFLLEAGLLGQSVNYDGRHQVDPAVDFDTIAIRELSNGLRYRAASPYTDDHAYGNHVDRMLKLRASASYVTGSHNFKVGFDDMIGSRLHTRQINGDVGYSFRNGSPSSIREFATPLAFRDHLDADLGIYAQDQWTVKRATINAGLRYDYYKATNLAFDLPAGRFVPARHFNEVNGALLWKDISPRLGVSYDVFGTGKTAIKGTLNRYVAGEGLLLANAVSPVTTSVTNVDRNWTDTNLNFIPDCDLTNPAQNGECQAISNSNFGKQNPSATTYDEDILHGFGKRQYDWETSGALQHQLWGGVSANIGYFRRWYGNQRVTDNLLVTPNDYSPYCVTAPADSRLPNGGGYQVCGLYDISPAKFNQVLSFVTPASTFGKASEVYNGLDFTVAARLRGGAQLSGGVSTGRTSTDNCVQVDSGQDLLNCKIVPPFQAQYKFIGSYPLPYGVQASAVFLSVPGPQITASYTATNAEIVKTLGRNLGSCGTAATCNGTTTVPLVVPGTMFAQKTARTDARFSKNFKLRQYRLVTSLDIYNLFNGSSPQTVNTTFGSDWQKPTQILGPRLFKVSGQIEF